VKAAIIAEVDDLWITGRTRAFTLSSTTSQLSGSKPTNDYLCYEIFLELSYSFVENRTHSILKRECDEKAVFL
jgi:hypothetical protein